MKQIGSSRSAELHHNALWQTLSFSLENWETWTYFLVSQGFLHTLFTRQQWLCTELQFVGALKINYICNEKCNFFFFLAVTIMRKKPFLNPLFFSPPLILFLLCCVILLPCHTRWVYCNRVIWILTWHDALLHKLLPSPPLLQTQLEDCVKKKKKEQRDKQVRIEPSENFAKLPRSWYHKKKNPIRLQD